MAPAFSRTFLGLWMLQAPLHAAAVTIAYCSSQNTGSSFSVVNDIYQSNGACSLTCAKYAYAIMQDKDCWCSNTTPGTTTSTSNCDDSCPGYPTDKCGNSDKGLYGYIAIGNAPSGTAGTSAGTTSTSVSEASTSLSESAATVTVTALPSDTLTTINTPSTTDTSSTDTTTSTQSTDTTSTTDAPASTTAPVVSVQTVGGGLVTVTVSNANQADSTSGSNAKVGHESSIGGGAIAGIVIGAIAGIALIAALFFWFCFKRQGGSSRGTASNYDPSIQNSLLAGTRSSQTSQMGFVRRLFNDEPPMSQPGTAATSPSAHRLSIPTFTDSRLNKDAMVYPNGHRLSDVSLQDNHDYSRPVLRLANPDPS